MKPLTQPRSAFAQVAQNLGADHQGPFEAKGGYFGAAQAAASKVNNGGDAARDPFVVEVPSVYGKIRDQVAPEKIIKPIKTASTETILRFAPTRCKVWGPCQTFKSSMCRSTSRPMAPVRA